MHSKTAVRSLDPDARAESELAGAREGRLAELFAAAELSEIEQTVLAVQVEHPSFESGGSRSRSVSGRRGRTRPGAPPATAT